MKALYLVLDALTLVFPVVLSFDARVKFYSKWKPSLIAAALVAVPFIIWDVIFTENGIWGFNLNYHTGIYIYNLPIEEILFFLVVPFACTFIYECCKYYFMQVPIKYMNRILHLELVIFILVFVIIDGDGWYTFIVSIVAILVVAWHSFHQHLMYTGIAFLFSHIPFCLMNGVLTGFFTEEPIVWYNSTDIMGYRILSIPLEDVVYSFALVTASMLVYEHLLKKGT